MCVCAMFQETLATLNLGAPGSELSERNKRTIGILRQLFPQLTQVTPRRRLAHVLTRNVLRDITTYDLSKLT